MAHAQFGTIHPFTDGNGRKGRVFAQSMLRRRGVTRNVAVPISAGLLSNIAGHHEALTSSRDGDVTPIVLEFSRAAEKAVMNARQLVADIDTIRGDWATKVHARKRSINLARSGAVTRYWARHVEAATFSDVAVSPRSVSWQRVGNTRDGPRLDHRATT